MAEGSEERPSTSSRRRPKQDDCDQCKSGGAVQQRHPVDTPADAHVGEAAIL
jgi:hypothetical protein